MRQTDPGAPWYVRYRMLIGIYLITMVFGVREYVVTRDRPEVDSLTEEWARMTEVMEELDPDHPDTEWLASIQAERGADPDAYLALMEEALATGAKHNDDLMQAYAQELLVRGEDYRRINQALNDWRLNHPTSAGTIWLGVGQPPRSSTEVALLDELMAGVDWVFAYDLEEVRQGDRSAVLIHLTFRPPHEVDIREAIAALTELTLTFEQRRAFRVVCLDLIDCNLEPR